ncbi:MAG: hypothetical protein V4550_00240 [Gemmatimonadota bacterium]
MWRRQMMVAVLIGVPACAPVTMAGKGEPVGRNSDVLTIAEMRGTDATDLYQAITRLRPMFLNRGRDFSAFRPNVSLVTVFLDNARLGSIESLRSIPVEYVKSVQYLSSSEATIRWGTNHTGSVILLTTTGR